MGKFEERRNQIRKMMRERNLALAAQTTVKMPVVKDADGNIVETSLMEMLELKGNKVTFDNQGNILIVKHPKLRP